jgi:hypothetical protein
MNEGNKMKKFLLRVNPFHVGPSRFDRYYAGVVGKGSGYPTADEARKDLRGMNHGWDYANWMR